MSTFSDNIILRDFHDTITGREGYNIRWAWKHLFDAYDACSACRGLVPSWGLYRRGVEIEKKKSIERNVDLRQPGVCPGAYIDCEDTVAQKLRPHACGAYRVSEGYERDPEEGDTIDTTTRSSGEAYIERLLGGGNAVLSVMNSYINRVGVGLESIVGDMDRFSLRRKQSRGDSVHLFDSGPGYELNLPTTGCHKLSRS